MSLLSKHGVIERNAFLLLVLSFLVVTIGGLVQIVPLFYLDNTIEKVEGVRPYSPLELAGRNIYVREGCYVCHSQMIRTMRDEQERYGHYSLAAESMYDHPFQWGSKRTGPDLARVGGRYSDAWHVAHFQNPRDLVPESIMPAYPVVRAEPGRARTRIAAVMRDQPHRRRALYRRDDRGRPRRFPRPGRSRQRRRRRRCSSAIPARWRATSTASPGITELDAVIAYLQMLGTLVDFSTYTPVPSR